MKVAQSCPTLCDSMDCMVHGILQELGTEVTAYYNNVIFHTLNEI